MISTKIKKSNVVDIIFQKSEIFCRSGMSDYNKHLHIIIITTDSILALFLKNPLNQSPSHKIIIKNNKKHSEKENRIV